MLKIIVVIVVAIGILSVIRKLWPVALRRINEILDHDDD